MPQHSDFSQIATATTVNSYKKRLKTWAIARQLPDMKQEIVARFRSRSDADGHMQLLRQMTPSASFMLVFDCQRDEIAV